MNNSWPKLADDAQRICQALLQIDTTNPPGNERPAADLVQTELEDSGYPTQIIESAPRRANLICRRPGDGSSAPLLLTAHLDVVEANPSQWQHPPFSGQEAEGCLWGRGAIDMKNMAAMCVAVFKQLARDQTLLSRDLIFAAVADEEAGCEYGSKFLVENHRELVEAEYAIGESGGFSLHVGKDTFYPIQVAEKGFCWVRATVRGEPGHGSMPRPDNPVLVLSERISRLAKHPFPVHDNRHLRQFLDLVGNKQPKLVQPLVRLLANKRLFPALLRRLPGESGTIRGLTALLSNTASPTVLRAGNKVNVIPDHAEVLIDGRTLPGQSDADFLAELADILGPEVDLEIVRSAPPVVTEPYDSALYQTMRKHIESREPGATVVPYMIPGFTDGTYFSRTGAKWYGFSPVKLERDSGLKFADMFHGHNERIPVAGLRWGAELLFDVVTDFCRTA